MILAAGMDEHLFWLYLTTVFSKRKHGLTICGESLSGSSRNIVAIPVTGQLYDGKGAIQRRWTDGQETRDDIPED